MDCLVPKLIDICRTRTDTLILFQSHQGGAWGEEPIGNENDRICIRVADFDFDKLKISANEFTIRSYTMDQIKKLTLKRGDILIEKSGGGDLHPVGRAIIFDDDIQAFL